MIYGVQDISRILKAWMRVLVLFSRDVASKKSAFFYKYPGYSDISQSRTVFQRQLTLIVSSCKPPVNKAHSKYTTSTVCA